MDEPEFAATLYRAKVEGAASVRLRLDAQGLRARAADGAEYVIGYDECQLERGGANGRMWFCRTPDRSLTMLCDAPDFGKALRGLAPPQLVASIDRIELHTARTQRSRGAAWITVLALVLVFSAGAYYGLRTAGRTAVDALPPSVDARLGDQAYAQLALQNKQLEDAALLTALRGMVERLAPPGEGDFEYRVHVFDEPVTNAFALPGGTLVVYTGLLRAAESPEQVAGVLAHEIAHVERRHGMRRIAQSLGVIAAFQLVVGDVSGLIGVAVGVLQEGAINSYSRTQEQEADLDAVQRLRRARIDPRALADFFEVLRRDDPGLPSALGWLGTHPDLGERVANIRAAVGRERDEWQPIAIDWAKLQRELPAARSTDSATARE
ncbi:MAG TPA: M48 family metallopeptidase [Polyangiales bacterium]|nr:M48 family metallopeptidase [Polyangiales bacterium]